MKKVLLEFYKELLPIFEKYNASIESAYFRGYSSFEILVRDSSAWCQENTSVDDDEEPLTPSLLRKLIKDIEDEETTDEPINRFRLRHSEGIV